MEQVYDKIVLWGYYMKEIIIFKRLIVKDEKNGIINVQKMQQLYRNIMKMIRR